MNRLAMTLAVIILAACVPATRADGMFGLFHKKVKVDPAQRVPELILTLKTEQDERKRGSAVTELGTYDSAAFAEIVPVLVDVLQHDAKASVRMDAASSLGALRPVSQLAGDALEKAATSDDNWRARLHAKSIVMRYRIAGYSPRGGQNAKSNEPPLMANTRQGTPQGPPRLTNFPPVPMAWPIRRLPRLRFQGTKTRPPSGLASPGLYRRARPFRRRCRKS